MKDSCSGAEVADYQALRSMARPGLEPGTPQFSVVRVSLSNRAKTPANKRDARGLQRAGKNRKFRSVLGDSGDRWRPVARWCASAAGGPHSAPGRALAVRSSRARTASLALPRAHLEQWRSSTSVCSHRHTPATAAPYLVSTAAFHGRRSVAGADRAAADAPSRRPKELRDRTRSNCATGCSSTTRSTAQAGPFVRVQGA
jgi:hypothetical protein